MNKKAAKWDDSEVRPGDMPYHLSPYSSPWNERYYDTHRRDYMDSDRHHRPMFQTSASDEPSLPIHHSRPRVMDRYVVVVTHGNHNINRGCLNHTNACIPPASFRRT